MNPCSSLTQRWHRLASLFVLVALTAGVLVACGSESSGQPPAGDDTTSTTAAVDPTTSTDPATADGEAVERPERIVSLSPTLTEIAFAVGAGDQVVAVDQYSNFPAGTPITELSGFRPNVEAIVGFEPDLVLLPSDRDGVVDALTGAGIPTLVLSSAADVDDALDQVLAIAEATGHAQAGVELVEDLRAGLDELAAAAEDAPTLTYYYELSDSYHSATSNSFIGSLLALIGLESIADGVDPEGGKFPQVTAEHILAADPDLILVGGAGPVRSSVAQIAGRPGWDQLTAVREGRVIELDEDRASRWGPRIVELLAEVADAIAATGAR